MGRGGGAAYKKGRANGRRRRRRPSYAENGDDDDEEYVVGEDGDEEEEEEEEDVSEGSLASSADEEEEEEFDFAGSGDSSTEEVELEEEDEEEVARSRSPRMPLSGRGRVKRLRVAVGDEVEEDEEGEGKTVLVARKKSKRTSRSGRRKARVSEDDEEQDDDEDFLPDEEEEEGDEEVSPDSIIRFDSLRNGNSRNTGRKRKSRVLKQSKKNKARKEPARKRHRRHARVKDEDDDFIVEDEVEVSRTRKKSNHMGTKDDDDDFIVEEEVEVSRTRKKSNHLGIKNQDDDFIMEDEVVVSRSRKKSNHLCKKRANLTRVRNRNPAGSDTSDSEYVMSDDVGEDEGWITVKKGRGQKRSALGTRKRQPSGGSESSDSDYVISEEELRDLGVRRGDPNEHKKILTGRRDEEKKGKEKEADDLGKQVCGICLSDEQKGTIQGTLNCCAHYFCFACIMEWSKVESRCPLCKRRFVTIAKSSRSELGLGLRKAVIRVEKRDQVYQPSEEEMRGLLDPYENVVCIECQQGGDDNLMLLCDICDSPAHTYCVGLGREVPEGNWYCECCRSAGEGSSNSQVQASVSDRGASINEANPRSFGVDAPTMQVFTSSQRSTSHIGQSSSRGIDLNLLPRDIPEDPVATSPMSVGGPSTLSGRREIQRRIRLLLSNNRTGHLYYRLSVPPHSIESNMIPPEVHQSRQAVNSFIGTEHHQRNGRPFVQPRTNLVAPCTSRDDSSPRNIEGAKEQVLPMVKNHLKQLSRESQLDHATIKNITRRATHTVLAACGITHNSRMVAAHVQPPSNCAHVLAGAESSWLVSTCCSSCFSSFVKDVVQEMMETNY